MSATFTLVDKNGQKALIPKKGVFLSPVITAILLKQQEEGNLSAEIVIEDFDALGVLGQFAAWADHHGEDPVFKVPTKLRELQRFDYDFFDCLSDVEISNLLIVAHGLQCVLLVEVLCTYIGKLLNGHTPETILKNLVSHSVKVQDEVVKEAGDEPEVPGMSESDVVKIEGDIGRAEEIIMEGLMKGVKKVLIQQEEDKANEPKEKENIEGEEEKPPNSGQEDTQ